METIRMIEICPGKTPRLIEVEHTVKKLSELVGGLIQGIYPWKDRVAIICDDEGKLKDYRPNRALEDENGNIYDVVVGTFYICGLGDDSFASISDEMAEKYMRKFQFPEYFYDGTAIGIRDIIHVKKDALTGDVMEKRIIDRSNL